MQYLLKSYGLAGPDAAPAIYPQELPRGKRAEWDPHAIIQRNASRCIQCGRCVAACKKLQGIGVWEFIGTGSRSSIGVADNRTMREAGCVACEMCIRDSIHNLHEWFVALVRQEAGKRRGRHRTFVDHTSEPSKIRFTTSFDGELERVRHRGYVASGCDRSIRHNSSRPHLHGFCSLRRTPDACIHDDG